MFNSQYIIDTTLQIKQFSYLKLGVPGLANFMDHIDVPLAAGDSIRWFRAFFSKMLDSNEDNSGRSKNFLNLFAQNRITEEEAKTALKVCKEVVIAKMTIFLVSRSNTHQICQNKTVK